MSEMQRDYFTIDDLADVHGKLIGTRVDVNTTLQCEGRFGLNERIITAIRNINALQAKGAKVVVLAHNGRRGTPDYVDIGAMLRDIEHEKAVKSGLAKVKYVGNTFVQDTNDLNSAASRAINGLKPGEALFLENIRYLGAEETQKTPQEHAQTPLVRTLIDALGMYAYVLDAFSVAHRAHMSIVGFAELPNIAGLQMDKELSALVEVRKRFMQDGDGAVYVLGGKKISDYLGLMERSLKEGRVGKILTGGFLGLLCLIAQGQDLGEKTRKALENEKDGKGKSMLDYAGKLKQLMDTYPGRFILPSDVAYLVDERRKAYSLEEIPEEAKSASPCFDIGRRTAQEYVTLITQAQVLYMKGPAGWYENREFNLGSQLLLFAFAGSDGYSVIGGGDTTAMLEHFRVGERKIDHISLAGGALVKALAGEDLPGMNVLRQSYVNPQHKELLRK